MLGFPSDRKNFQNICWRVQKQSEPHKSSPISKEEVHKVLSPRVTGRDRAALKATNLRGQMPICKILRVPSKFCSFLQRSVSSKQEARISTPMLCEEVPSEHLEGSLVYMPFSFFSLENKLFGIHQTSFLA